MTNLPQDRVSLEVYNALSNLSFLIWKILLAIIPSFALSCNILRHANVNCGNYFLGGIGGGGCHVWCDLYQTGGLWNKSTITIWRFLSFVNLWWLGVDYSSICERVAHLIASQINNTRIISWVIKTKGNKRWENCFNNRRLRKHRKIVNQC